MIINDTKYMHVPVKMNVAQHCNELEDNQPDSKVTGRFNPAYQLEHCDVIEYLARKYDIKGEMRIGQEDS